MRGFFERRGRKGYAENAKGKPNNYPVCVDLVVKFLWLI
jgi:hypothetical protein